MDTNPFTERRNGLTLVELLVAMVVTMLLVASLAEVFAYFSTTISANRATIEMSGQLRGATSRLQPDLEGITVPVRPWPQADSGLGYFEYFEGPSRDYDSARADLSFGDVDDIIMFTSRSNREPFLGRIYASLNNSEASFSSNVAEIIWWTSLDDKNGNGTWESDQGERFQLHRRTLLIRPDLNNDNGYLLVTSDPIATFQNENDLSVHADTILDTSVDPPVRRRVLVANSLADLTIRKNRFAHVSVLHNPPSRRQGFPHRIDNVYFPAGSPPVIGLLKSAYAQHDNTLRGVYHVGEDVVLANVLSFDVKAYDPNVPVRRLPTGTAALLPSDPGYYMAGVTQIGQGGYVDLNYNSAMNSYFSDPPNRRSQLFIPSAGGFRPLATYDTWSFDYEHDGINQDGPVTTPDSLRVPPNRVDPSTGTIDEGTDGFDTPAPVLRGSPPTWQLISYNGIDDVGERETSPPYPVPLRGIQIRVRIIDPDSRQVRQMTVVSDFTPE